LSGGQKQKIAIARALYKNPEILIFDEATSSLDGTSQKNIWSAIKTLKGQEKTIIVSTHRLQSITEADGIVVLKNGVLTEQGTHQILLKSKAAYFELWQNQTLTA
jgi:ATP-binding cassette subfamily B protein